MTKILYLVMKAETEMQIMGEPGRCKLPDGHYVIPAFESLDDAVEVANGKFEIMQVKAGGK